jgi:hypothetical protein
VADVDGARCRLLLSLDMELGSVVEPARPPQRPWHGMKLK